MSLLASNGRNDIQMQEYQSSNFKKSLICKKLATRPRESVYTDLFKWDGEDYLLVDSYSHFIEIANITNYTVVMHTKSIFTLAGIPKTVKSDNDP